MGAFERLGDRMEGKGKLILYTLAGLIALGILFGVYSWWSAQRANKARAELGRAFDIATATIGQQTDPNSKAQTFQSERERAQKALQEFQKVTGKYGDPYDDIARYMAATQLLTVERAKGLSELEAITKSGNREVAARAKFSLAQAKEADGQLDPALSLYTELLKDGDPVIVPDTINLRIASVYEKQGKKDEAVNILFRIVEASRKAKDKDGKAEPPPEAAAHATEKLRSLDPARFAQLPPEPPAGKLPF
jgi:predicted negative regulator of RcsB-dependent stress response